MTGVGNAAGRAVASGWLPLVPLPLTAALPLACPLLAGPLPLLTATCRWHVRCRARHCLYRSGQQSLGDRNHPARDFSCAVGLGRGYRHGTAQVHVLCPQRGHGRRECGDFVAPATPLGKLAAQRRDLVSTPSKLGDAFGAFGLEDRGRCF
jgi:hypothetical protein